MKLFLASSLDKTISLLKERVPKSAKWVLFIANAADPYDERWWVDLDREAFIKLGFEIIEVDLRKITKEEFEQKLKNVDIVHLCGGSVFYLISILREKNVADLIIDIVKNEKVIYTGTSAGSMIPAKELFLLKYEVEESAFYKQESDSKGLDLVNFLILPHCNQEAFAENNKNVVEHAHESSIPLLLLKDDQAVWVEDEKMELVSV